jgi:opacity protein-like surface antigen
MKKVFSVIVLCSFLLPSAMNAQVAFGIRLATSSGLGNLGPTNMQGGYVGINLGHRIYAIGGFDFSKFTSESDQKNSISSFTPFGGIKFFLRESDDGLVTPYVRGDFFKSITRWPNMGDSALQLVSGLLGPSQVTMTKRETEEFLKEILSPWGFNLAFGAEYNLSDEFSLGGEFGLRSSFSKAEVNISDTGTLSTTEARFHDTYVALTLNFLL